MKKILFVTSFLLVGLAFPIRNALADVDAPPVFSQGGLLDTTVEATNVSMDSETVDLHYDAPKKTSSSGGSDMVMPVHVTATFTMNNTGSKEENLLVSFPSMDSDFIDGRGGDVFPITNFSVNGQKLLTNKTTTIPALINSTQKQIHVYQWYQTFPAGQSTKLTISYDSQSGLDFGVYYLTYVLGTGRGWKGPIGHGTIRFILPYALTDYSVVDRLPLISAKSPLPYTIDDQTITIEFTNYEPEPDAVIALGAADMDLVNRIESLKNETSNFANTLSLAAAYQELSIGPHCSFCVGKSAALSKEVFMSALDRATTKDEIYKTLGFFMFGDPVYYQMPEPIDPFPLFSFSNCKSGDTGCQYNDYSSRDGMGDTPFHLGYDTREVENLDFLQKYVDKIRPFDSSEADIVANYINEAPNAIKWYNENFPATTETDGTNVNTASNTNNTIVANSNKDESVMPQQATPGTSEDADNISLSKKIVASVVLTCVALGGAALIAIRRKKSRGEEKKR